MRNEAGPSSSSGEQLPNLLAEFVGCLSNPPPLFSEVVSNDLTAALIATA